MILCSMLPVVKIDADVFLIGTQVKKLHLSENKIVFSTGGGFVELSDWMKKNSVLQSIKFSKLLAES